MLILILEEEISHMIHLTMDLLNQSLNFIITDRYIFFLQNSSYKSNVEKAGQEVMYYSKQISSNYMRFVGYDTCDKLIRISGEGNIIIIKISIQGTPKTHINKISPS